MPLTVSSHLEDNVAVLQLEGSLTLGPSLNALRDCTRDLLNGSKLSGMILNVGGVTIVDSAGLGELTVVYTFTSKRGCPLRLIHVTPNLRKMLEMTRLDGLLPTAPDLATAKKELGAR